jgi:hypothetical protein
MRDTRPRALGAKLLTSLLLACLSAGTAAAQASRIDTNALTEETQKSHPDPDRMALVWWIPEEFWEATLAQDPATSKAQAEAFLKTVRPYLIFGVVDGKMGAFGGVTYKSEATIRSTIEVVDARGAAHLPIAHEKVDADTRNLLAMMRPVLSNVIGKTGENLHFVLFPATDAAGRRIADANAEGMLTLKLGADVFKWRLPLASLLPPKVCPVDGEQMSGGWKFCPWHGERLAPKPDNKRF